VTALAAALVLLAAPAPAAAPVLAWQTLVPGAERATLSLDEGRPLELVRFDLERFRAEVVVGKGQPPQARTAEELRRSRGAVAAVNGGFFDERVVPLGLRVSDGEQRFPLRAKADWGVLILTGRRARIVHTREYPALPLEKDAAGDERIDGAIQVGPRLLVGGVPTKLRPQLARRTAVALDAQGRQLTLIIAPDPIDANDLAARLAAEGFADAILLDGGPSTQASLDLGTARLEVAGGYPVPDLLAVFPRGARRKVNGPTAPSTTTPRKP
jgi:uncharacterized protein YigE (DUF2233 family)